MRSITKVAFLLILLISTLNLTAHCGGLGSERLLWEANQLYREYKDVEALEKFEQVLAGNPSQIEALCKASIVCGRIGGRFQDDTSKGIYFQKALKFAERSLAVDSLTADTNYAMALSLGNLSQTVSLRERIEMMVQIKHYLDRALAQDTTHAGSWHLMGRWRYKVANLSLTERAVCKLYGVKMFPEVTNAEAIVAIYKSIELEPTNLLFYYDLARVQREVDQKSECVSTLQKALDQKPITTEDLELSRKCKVLLQEVLRVRS